MESVQAEKMDRAAFVEIIRQKAREQWDKATDNQKAGVRFGMIDIGMSRAAGIDMRDGAAVREFSLGLMACASQDGGMRA